MRALLVNLRRIATSADREQSRYADLLRLASWFESADDDTAHALWAAAFGLYSCRHLGFPADDDSEPVPPTASWWRASVAQVPITLRQSGERKVAGASGRRADFSAAKHARLLDRAHLETRRRAAFAEITAYAGEPAHLRLSDEARTALLEIYARALTGAGGRAMGSAGVAEASVAAGDAPAFRLSLRPSPGRSTTVSSPAGRLELVDLTIGVAVAAEDAAEEEEKTG
jgi:hypothetical protein